MPAILNCACGKSMEVPDMYAGKRVHCPGCNEAVLVPAAEQSEESAPTPQRQRRDEDGYSDRLRDVNAQPERSRRDQSDSDANGYGDRRSRHDQEDRRDIRRLIRKENDRPNRRLGALSTGGGGFGGVNAGVGGGLAMMGIAVVWFFVALAAGWIFFYPPILFVIGVIAVVKGLANGE